MSQYNFYHLEQDVKLEFHISKKTAEICWLINMTQWRNIVMGKHFSWRDKCLRRDVTRVIVTAY